MRASRRRMSLIIASIEVTSRPTEANHTIVPRSSFRLAGGTPRFVAAVTSRICPSTDPRAPACPRQARFRASPGSRARIGHRRTRPHPPRPPRSRAPPDAPARRVASPVPVQRRAPAARHRDGRPAPCHRHGAERRRRHARLAFMHAIGKCDSRSEKARKSPDERDLLK